VVLLEKCGRLGITGPGSSLEISALLTQVSEAGLTRSAMVGIATPLGHACVRISGPRRVNIERSSNLGVGSALSVDRLRPQRATVNVPRTAGHVDPADRSDRGSARADDKAVARPTNLVRA
jgi:hypothetical protein